MSDPQTTQGDSLTHFIVTFRIAGDTGYQTRYESFVKRIHEVALGGAGLTWEETTSFCSFQALGTDDSICQDLYLNSDFDSTKDIMVVIDLDTRKKSTKGPAKYLTTLANTLGF